MLFTGYIPRAKPNRKAALRIREDLGIGVDEKLVVLTTGGGGDGLVGVAAGVGGGSTGALDGTTLQWLVIRPATRAKAAPRCFRSRLKDLGMALSYLRVGWVQLAQLPAG